ncbi:MAG: hypothetical protein IPH86_01775 [bacterium]|nr:hypothetical protein [bacterium]
MAQFTECDRERVGQPVVGIRGGTLHAAVDFVPVGGLAIAVRFGPQPEIAALVFGDDKQVGAVIHPFDPRGVGAEADPSIDLDGANPVAGIALESRVVFLGAGAS